jgi:NADH-quinone oxidoreductase subunit G
MPCTAKKFEIIRSKEMHSSGFWDVDTSLTTRELARMIKQSGINFKALAEEQPDQLLGAYTGAGTIFGTTGGVMEAALRTSHFLITGENPGRIDFQATRGLKGVKEGKTVLARVREARDAGTEPPYHFIEVMACPGGCVGGGGQPYGVTDKLRAKRAAGLYQDDQAGLWRCSHENPYIQKLYEDFLGEPLGEKSQQLLHTSYYERATYRR